MGNVSIRGEAPIRGVAASKCNGVRYHRGLPRSDSWSPAEIQILKQLWPDTPRAEIARQIGRSLPAIEAKGKKLRLGSPLDRNDWPEDKTEQLKTLWFLHPASFVGRLLGFTKSAVIGKANRLGLYKPKPQPIQTRRAQQNREAARRHRLRKNGCYVETPRTVAPPCPELPPLNIPLIETTFGQCKFIPGDDGRCCGQPTKPESPYCAHHHKICHVPRGQAKQAAFLFRPSNGAWV